MYAITLASVIEIFRPLPIQSIPGLPSFVLGISLIRGEATPVVHLNALVNGEEPAGSTTRFVLLRVEPRPIALAVEQVIRICDLDISHFGELPYLLHNSSAEVISAVGAVDQKLLLILQAARVISKELWESLEAQQLKNKSSVI
jgi:purine-binding chemotaxis protein CheW